LIFSLAADAASLVHVTGVTRILDRVQQGDPKAAEELLPLAPNNAPRHATSVRQASQRLGLR